MYARLTRGQVKIDRLEYAIKVIKESVVPATKMQMGYKGFYLFLNKKTGEGLTLSLWESEEDASASEKNHHYQEQLIKLINHFTGPPVREGYEVEHFELKE